MSIKTKLLSVIVGALMVVGLVMGIVIYWQNTQKLNEHINTDVENIINYTSQLVNFYFGQAESSLINLANDPIIIAALETKNQATLVQASQKMTVIVETVGVIENIGLHEIIGSTCIARSADKLAMSIVGSDWSERDYCKGIIKTKAPYLSSAYISAISKNPVLGLAVPVKNTKGEMLGYVMGTIGLSELRGYLWDLQENSKVELLDRYGTMFLNTDEKIEALDNLSSVEGAEISEIKKELASKKREGYFSDGDNFVGYRFNGSITVVYEKAESELLALSNTINLTILWAQIIATFLVVLIIYLFIGTITKRIFRLSNITQEIAGGKFDIKIDENDLKAKDEIAVLAENFNKMVVNLKDARTNIEKKVEERTQELLEKNTLLDAESETTLDGILVVDPKGKTILMNENFGLLWKIPQNILDTKDDKKMIEVILPQLKNPGKFVEKVEYLYSHQGEKSRDEVDFIDGRVFDRYSGPLIDNSGKYYGRIWYFRDITNLKEIERTMADQKNKLEIILRGIGDGVFVTDMEHRLVIFNEVASKISGFSEEEAIGKDYHDVLKFIFEDNEKENDQFIKRAIETGKITEMSNHTLLVRKDGTKVAVADSAAPIKDKTNKVIGCVVVFRDATKERELDRAKTEFISIASHQLRTPVSALRWLTEALSSSLKGKKLNEKQQTYFNGLSSSTTRLVGLVEDLLNLSRIQLGTFEQEKMEINAMDFVNEFAKDMEVYAQSKNHTISIKTPVNSQSLPVVYVSRKKIYMVMQNFVSNAIEYSPAGTSVTITIAGEEGGFIKISVSNNGPAIPKEDQSHLFGKFYRSEQAKKIKPEGSGLGLYIIKEIVEGWGGKVGFTSPAPSGVEGEEGQETTFWFTAPIKK